MRTSRQTTLYCFTPAVTFATALIEAACGLYTLYKYRATKFGRLFALLLFLLAVFQISEYFICKTNSRFVWAQIGWIAITFLPVIGLHLVTMITGRSAWLRIGYVITVLFASIFVVKTFFFPEVSCPGNYVRFASPGNLFTIMYIIFYFLFLAVAIWKLCVAWYMKSANARLIRWFLIGYGSFIIPTFLLYVFLTPTTDAFPSIFCGFAIFLALIVVGKVLPVYHATKGIEKV